MQKMCKNCTNWIEGTISDFCSVIRDDNGLIHRKKFEFCISPDKFNPIKPILIESNPYNRCGKCLRASVLKNGKIILCDVYGQLNLTNREVRCEESYVPCLNKLGKSNQKGVSIFFRDFYSNLKKVQKEIDKDLTDISHNCFRLRNDEYILPKEIVRCAKDILTKVDEIYKLAGIQQKITKATITMF